MDFKLKNTKKTGTTIVGLKYKDGILLLSDTRSTIGDMVENTNVQKLHKISKNIYCAGCGLAADADRLTRKCEARQSYFERKFKTESLVSSVNSFMTTELHSYQGNIEAAFILGGVDGSGSFLFDIHSYGSSSEVNYCALGSGSLAAISVLEGSYKENMDEKSILELGILAIETGIKNDLYSGSNVDCVFITKNGSEFRRSVKVVFKKENKSKFYFDKNKIKILSEEIIKVGNN